MRHTFLNIASFFKNEKLLLFIIFICIFSSAFVMNFSYGLYMNYNTALNEANENLKTIVPTISKSKKLTKGEFQQFVEELDIKTQDEINLIFASSDLTKIGYDDHYSYFPMRFDINNNKFCASEYVKEIWESTKLIKKGEYLSNDDEETGAYFALVPQSIIDKTIGESIELFGHTYVIKGIYDGSSNTPLVPFLTIPDDIEIDDCSFNFSDAVTRSAYDDLKAAANKTIPGKLSFPELQLPDDDTASLYRNIILISILIAAVSVANFAMLYLFMIRKRRRELAIMRICGAVKLQVTAIYLGECLIITIPVFLLGDFAFDIMLKAVFSDHFPYMTEAFSPLVYIFISVIYIVVMAIILGIMIVKNINSDIKECLAEGNI